VPVAMESLYRPSALVWAMASAVVFFWGTGLIASKRLIKNRVSPLSWLALWKRQVADGFWICAEELLYAYLALLNVITGVVFWILDFYHEGKPPSNANYFPVVPQLEKVAEPDLRNPDFEETKPRRAGILRPRKVKGNVCGCWGYDVPEPDYGVFTAQNEDAEEVKPVRPRWSDCQCSECTVLLMTQKEASSRLFVRCEDSASGGERCTDYHGTESKVSNTENLNPVFASDSNPRHGTATRESTAVVFLHGLFSSSSFWFDTKLIPRLAEEIKARHRILAPDLLGCGRSPRPVDCAYTVADHVQALEKSIIQRHGLESFHIVAHSMGCTMALVLAALYPERVRSITLIAPVYPPGDFDDNGKLARLPCASFFSFLQPFTVKGLRGLLVSKYYNLSRAVAHLFYARHTFWVSYLHKKMKRFPLSFIADYITNHHDAAWHMTHNSLLGGTHAVIPALIKLQKLQKRIMVYHGVDDTSCHISLAEEMSRRFSNVELHSVPGYGHVDVVWKREEEPCAFIEQEIFAGDANFAAMNSIL